MPTKPIHRKERVIHRSKQKRNWNRKGIILVSIVILCVLGVSLYVLVSKPLTERLVPKGVMGRKTDDEESSALPVKGDVQFAITKARLQLESVDNRDVVKVIVEKVSGRDVEGVTYKYEWLNNGQPAGDGDSISGFKRGDRIAVKITPFDGDKPGQPRTLSMEIQNSTPKVSEGKQLKYDGKTFSYQVNASDPDGDPLAYALVESPKDMSIDTKTGTINWQMKEGDYGLHTVKV